MTYERSPYELVWPAPTPAPPPPDARQAALLGSWTGPLLVLGGPGTGKSTLAAHAALGVLRAGGRPLVFARTRHAASTLRNLVTAGLAGAVWQPAVTTVFAFCRTVLQRFASDEWRLLTAPEQEYRVRELLAGHPGLWPADLRQAVGTSAFARQVRTGLARARQLGLDPADVERAGRAAGDDAWVALGRFFAEYLDVLDAEQALDYAELVHRARIALARPEVYAVLAPEADAVIVDDYPELDPAQVGVVAALAPRGTRVLATGDPHTVLSAFRGAHPRAVTDFPALFTAADGSPGAVASLDEGHRQGGTLALAVSRVAARLAAPAVGAVSSQLCPVPAARPGEVAVIECANEAEQYAAIARELRAARLHGYAYADMAVLVRSGGRGLDALARALGRGGVPVRLAPADVPLAQARPVVTLLAALNAAADARVRPEVAEGLACSPLCGLDPVGLRRVVRAHRAIVADAPMPAGNRLADALDDPSWCAAAAGTPWEAAVGAFERFARLLADARARLAAGGAADEVAWDLWQQSGWAAQLSAEAARGGALGVRAGGDLAALEAFFAFAGAGERRPGAAGVRLLAATVAAQQIPADYEREARRGEWGVEVTTVHRAKGRDWPLVVVAGLNEGAWPALRRAPGRLAADRLRSDGLTGVPDVREHIAAERRMFYAACAASSRRLVVTYLGAGAEQPPSRFVGELGVPARVAVADDEPRDVAALVAHLRREAMSGETPRARREAAAAVLGRLADERTASGEPLAPAADPGTWWGVRELSGPPAAPLAAATLHPSEIAKLLTCPRQFFLERQAQADPGTSAAREFGQLIHQLVQRAETEGWGSAELFAALEESWAQLPYDVDWVSAGQLEQARLALGRFLAWRRERGPAQLAGVEQRFRLPLEYDGVHLTVSGVVDRLERLPDGRLRVIDFKTSSAAMPKEKAAQDEQLGVYQLAVDAGVLPGSAAGCAGAALVFLKQPLASGLPVERTQAKLGGDNAGWLHDRLAQAAAILRDGAYPATPGEGCGRCAVANSCPAGDKGKQVIR